MPETEEKPIQRTGIYTIRRIITPYMVDRAMSGYALWIREDMERHLAEHIRQCQMDGRPYVTTISTWQIGYHPRFDVGRFASANIEEEGWCVHERELLRDEMFKSRGEAQRPANFCAIRCVCVLLWPEDAEVGEYIYPQSKRAVLVSPVVESTPESSMMPECFRNVDGKEFEYVPHWAWKRVR